MLCDLQCQSSSPSSSTTSRASWWTTLFLYLMHINMQTCYRTLLVALWTLSPSRMARLMQVSALSSTSRSTISSMTPRLLRSTPGRLARYNAATGLSAPQRSANALARQSPDEVQRARAELTARQAQTDQTRMALSEQSQGAGRGPEDHTMGDDGDENHGVRSDELI